MLAVKFKYTLVGIFQFMHQKVMVTCNKHFITTGEHAELIKMLSIYAETQRGFIVGGC